MSQVKQLPAHPTWAQAEALLRAAMPGDADAWIEKPLKRFGGRSFRETFESDRQAATDYLHQIAEGYVF
jgi:hypothetical protein